MHRAGKVDAALASLLNTLRPLESTPYYKYLTLMISNKGKVESQTELFEFVDSLTERQRHRLYQSKWLDANPPPQSEIDRLFDLWRKVPVRTIEFPHKCARIQASKNPRNLSPILTVDASPTKGGGVYFDPISKICLTYSVDFEKDLGMPCIDDGQIFEMFNLLFALFVFKQKLVNTEFIRIVNDHHKIRQPKKSVIVPTIYKIVKWLGEERDLTVVNNENPDGNWNLTTTDYEKQFLKLADCLSKDKVFQKDAFPDFSDIYICPVSEDVVKKYYGYF